MLASAAIGGTSRAEPTRANDVGGSSTDPTVPLAPRPSDGRAHLFDKVRLGVWGGTWSGSRLAGEGSVARVQKASVDLELGVTRYFSRRFGVDILVLGLPYADDYVRFDVGFDAVLSQWGGSTPGGLTFALGVGGDHGRYPYAGRIYPRAVLRARVLASRENTVEAAVEVLPVSFGPDGRIVQHRSELSFARGLFQAGFRVSHAFHTVGDPSRTFMMQELGLFVGVGIMP